MSSKTLFSILRLSSCSLTCATRKLLLNGFFLGFQYLNGTSFFSFFPAVLLLGVA